MGSQHAEPKFCNNKKTEKITLHSEKKTNQKYNLKQKNKPIIQLKTNIQNETTHWKNV
jgi:hypothetical protein